MKAIIKICFSLILFSMHGCVEEQIHQVGLHGTLKGYVYGLNNNTSIPYSLENASVKLEGSKPEISLLTDDKGTFSIADLETGTYNIVLSKPGFGTYKILGYSFVGGSESSQIFANMYELPILQITKVEASIGSGINDYYVRCTVYSNNPATGFTSGFFRYYLSQQADVSRSHYQESGILGPFFQGGTSNVFIFGLNPKKYTSGGDVYLIVYPCAEQTSSYVDLDTGTKIYASTGESNSGIIKLHIP